MIISYVDGKNGEMAFCVYFFLEHEKGFDEWIRFSWPKIKFLWQYVNYVERVGSFAFVLVFFFHCVFVFKETIDDICA